MVSYYKIDYKSSSHNFLQSATCNLSSQPLKHSLRGASFLVVVAIAAGVENGKELVLRSSQKRPTACPWKPLQHRLRTRANRQVAGTDVEQDGVQRPLTFSPRVSMPLQILPNLRGTKRRLNPLGRHLDPIPRWTTPHCIRGHLHHEGTNGRILPLCIGIRPI